MKRGLLLGSTALVSAVGAFIFPAGEHMPTFLVGEATSLLIQPEKSPGPSNGTPDPQNRTIVGDAINTRYGTVQIQINVSGNTINSVDILQAPTGENARFTNYAMPILMRETVKAQSANISSVSGASYTSMGFIQSLQSAVAQM
jgi:hypothetical protein